MREHIGDDAELYALGVLEPHERDAVDAHLATCGACSRAVAEAERVSLGLGAIDWDALPARAPWRIPAHWFATAAALVLAIGLGGLYGHERSVANTLRVDDDIAFATLASSHFLHAGFQLKSPAADPTKVLYARDGSWLFVVVDGYAAGDRIVDLDARPGSAPLAFARARGATAVAFVKPRVRVIHLALEDPAGTILATVALPYPRTTR